MQEACLAAGSDTSHLSLSLSEPQAPHLSNKDDGSPCLGGCLEDLARGLAHSEHSETVGLQLSAPLGSCPRLRPQSHIRSWYQPLTLMDRKVHHGGQKI